MLFHPDLDTPAPRSVRELDEERRREQLSPSISLGRLVMALLRAFRRPSGSARAWLVTGIRKDAYAEAHRVKVVPSCWRSVGRSVRRH